ncbi:DUF1232 domain-containing protein [Phormidesmis priestleyi ULC007]|uniref:DUF1232 domain-containing protein n=1 Tax=Phormidesmis priestleyi ULC007 TaxID=1920490 RepID=A0A2T1D4X3_9CYAN|nr:YkvA family protein [Phormidesmis priestleyi]PSB15553.1 DUF1232 domain-containing protein [Phormidesmis priestleyi ULC007]PZO46325.1 MAG: DUF1232 domain-containing protein [Phormidesmis priestleyi]
MKFFLKPLYTWYRTTLRNSKYRWLIVLGSLIYLVSPFNLVTDAIPVLGWIDDGLIATVLVTEVSQLLLEQLKTRKPKSAEPKTVVS